MVQAVSLAVLRGSVLALIFFVLRACYVRWRGRQGLAMGDVKLAFVAGAWLGSLMIPIAIKLAAFAALSAISCTIRCPVDLSRPRAGCPLVLFFAPAIWICWLLEVRWLNAF